MGSVIENAKTKEKCQIFTPDDIVETMLDHVGYIDSLYGKTILENSCGNGQFLKGIVKRYINDCKRKGLSRTKIKNGLGRDIFGIELDPSLYREFFDTLSSLLIAIISIFEKDRAHIVKNIKQYNDQQNQRERAKEEAAGIAKTILGKKNKRSKEKDADTASDTEKLATAVQIYQEEREELISEIKLLRALATNGLMTTTMVHDLKSINALLVSRVRGFKLAIRQNDTLQIQRNLDDLKTNDEFLKSWITVITTQTKKDRRRRLKTDIYKVLSESLKLISPILNRKMVEVQFATDGGEAYKKIFATDFDSIIYNLVINSIESF